jgi:hypothetical protein
MPEDINQPLESLSFSDLIGKPLLSCIAAQERASHAVWKYIEDVGLTEESDGNKEAVIVSFSFVSQGQEIRLSVPLLSIVPIPYFSIDSLDINFRANVTAVENDTLKATYSFSKDSSAAADNEYYAENAIDVKVRATQDSMPAGLSKVMNFLEQSITVYDNDNQVIATKQ